MTPKILSVDTILNRSNIMNSYLNGFFSPNNKSFSQGEVIEIISGTILSLWLKCIITVDPGTREIEYKN